VFDQQALALPAFEDMNMPEHISTAEDMNMPEHMPKNEVVDAFREEINRQFARYQHFYDQTNAAMRTYRIRHVALVSEIYNGLMVAMGDRIEEVRMAAYELQDLIDARIEEVGMNDCVIDVMTRRNSNSGRVGTNIQACALYANTTLTGMLANTFYPTFAAVQTETSGIPISVIDVLSRGNVLQDEAAIIQYMNDRYEVYELQWLGAVSQLLRWETSRFNVEGLFLTDQTEICMADAIWEFLLTNSLLEGQIQEC
jgi:hypothetical protein